jgi:hypothetical protein
MSMQTFYCHDIPKNKRDWKNEEYIQILSVDPAILNFALRVERRYFTGLKEGNVETILFWKKDFTKNTFVEIFKELERYSNVYLNTHVFIVEKQMKRKDMLMIMQHILTYFMTKTKNYPLLPDIVEISAKVKGKQLGFIIDNKTNSTKNSERKGAKKGEKKVKGEKGKEIKKWSINIAMEMLEERKDDFGLDVMEYWLSKEHILKVRKIDDLADCVIMIEAYFQIKFNCYHQDMIEIRSNREIRGYNMMVRKKKLKIIKTDNTDTAVMNR